MNPPYNRSVACLTAFNERLEGSEVEDVIGLQLITPSQRDVVLRLWGTSGWEYPPPLHMSFAIP